jgi:hypothetical protein
MEDDDAPEETQRVRILSTLESTRRTSRPNRTQGGRQTRQGQRSIWLQGALWGAMGMGVLALMVGFILVIQDSKPAVAHAARPAPRVATSHAAASPTTAAPQGPAVIETTASAEPGLTAAAASAPTVLTPTTGAPPTAMEPAAVHKAEDSPRTKTTTAAAAKPNKSRSAKGQDEDVALLEAMFAHTGRKAPAPAPKN